MHSACSIFRDPVSAKVECTNAVQKLLKILLAVSLIESRRHKAWVGDRIRVVEVESNVENFPPR